MKMAAPRLYAKKIQSYYGIAFIVEHATQVTVKKAWESPRN